MFMHRFPKNALENISQQVLYAMCILIGRLLSELKTIKCTASECPVLAHENSIVKVFTRFVSTTYYCQKRGEIPKSDEYLYTDYTHAQLEKFTAQIAKVCVRVNFVK